MADKSMFSIEVETATFDHFKSSFDDYHSKLQATLFIWKQVSAEINNAANMLKGLNLSGAGAGGGSSGGTPSSITSMSVRAGTVTITAGHRELSPVEQAAAFHPAAASSARHRRRTPCT